VYEFPPSRPIAIVCVVWCKRCKIHACDVTNHKIIFMSIAILSACATPALLPHLYYAVPVSMGCSCSQRHRTNKSKKPTQLSALLNCIMNPMLFHLLLCDSLSAFACQLPHCSGISFCTTGLVDDLALGEVSKFLCHAVVVNRNRHIAHFRRCCCSIWRVLLLILFALQLQCVNSSP
jgi:hypothetical protein